MHLNIQSGSMNETDEQQGLAHFLEHMLFNGTEHFAPGELIKYFQSIGMDFGGDVNAHTSFFETVYDVVLPKGDSENFEKGLLVMGDYACGALLLSAEIDRERGVVLAEKRSRDSASYRTFLETLQFEMPDMLMSKRLPIGTEEAIKKADRDLFKDYYDTWYRPELMILVVVGDFDTDFAASLIEEKFSTVTARAPVRSLLDKGTISHKGRKAFYHYEKEAGNTDVSIELLRKVEYEPDSFSLQKRQMVKSFADRIINYRLREIVRSPDSPFTSAYTSSGIYLKHIEYAEISAKCSPENWDTSLALIEQTLRKGLTYGFTEAELDRIKKEYLSNLDKAVKSASTRKSQSLSRSIIRSMNNDRVFMSPVQKQEIFSPIIESITLAQVHEAFKKTWEPDHRLVLVTGNAVLASGDILPDAMILEAMGKSSQVAVSRPVNKADVIFPYLPEPAHKGQVVSTDETADLGIISMDFQNGVRLNMKKTDFKANEVIATLAFGYGKSSEPENKPGLAVLSSSVINESGFGKLKKEDMERALAGKNTHVTFSIKNNMFVFRGSSVTNEISLLFQLFQTHLIDPGYREDAYTLSMERFHQRYQSLPHTIEGAIMLKGTRFFAGGDSRFGLPAYDVFKELKLQDIRDFVNNSVKVDDIEISIVGDFDPETVIEAVSIYIGSIPLQKMDSPIKRSQGPEFPNGQRLDLTVSTHIPKGLVQVAYPTDDFWDIKRTRRLSMLGEVYSERLRVKIREKLGASYSPYAYNSASRAYKGYGVFQAVIQVDPGKTDVVVKEVKKISTDLAKNGVTEEAFKRALDPVLTGIKDMRRTNRYWLDSVLAGLKRHPRQLEWARTFQEDYASITADELSALAGIYLDNKKASVVTVRPE